MKLIGNSAPSETSLDQKVTGAFGYANGIAPHLGEVTYKFDTPPFKYDDRTIAPSDSEAERISLIQSLMAQCSANACLQAKSKTRRDAAVQGVLEWVKPRTRFDLTAYSYEADQKRLCALLDQCLAAGVSKNCVQLRDALINQDYLLLYDQPKYAKYFATVLADRERQGLPSEEMFRYVTSS